MRFFLESVYLLGAVALWGCILGILSPSDVSARVYNLDTSNSNGSLHGGCLGL